MIVIYTKTGCSWCKEALGLLQDKGVQFEEREVHSSQKYFEELVAKSGQDKTPTIDMDGEIIADTDAESIKIFLTDKGVI